MTGFLRLDDLILPPPLPAVVSMALTAGIVGIGEAALRRFRAEATVTERCAAFVVAAGVVGAIVHGLALAHLATPGALRVVAAAVVAFGAFAALPAMKDLAAGIGAAWRESAGADRWALIVSLGAIGSLALAALGPVTDADSLDYHLGAPLEWLRHGGMNAPPHWLHVRITGLGEALNMLGLAAGTDGLGAVLQVSGLVAVVAALRALSATVRGRALATLLALPPAVIPLAASQKPQLLPAAAIVLAVLLARGEMSAVAAALATGAIGFAMASKYSFLVSGGVALTFALYSAWRRGRLKQAMGWAAAASAALPLPVFARNMAMFGDPLSPFLESLKLHPDAEVTSFAASLQNSGAPHNWQGALHFLVQLVAPHGPGDIQIVMGLGVVCVLLVSAKGIQWAAFAGLALVLLFSAWRGQMAPRYLLEPYLWCVAGLTLSPSPVWRGAMGRLLFGALTAQTAAVAAMALAGAFFFFPGALTPGLREWTMRRFTYGYEESRWLDRALPPDAVIMSESRAHALFPRPVRIAEGGAFDTRPLSELVRPEDAPPGHPVVLVTQAPAEGKLPEGCRSETAAGPETVNYATRNPFNGSRYALIALRVECQ